MNPKTADTIVILALSMFLYIWLPMFGLLKAYATGEFVWLGALGIWVFAPWATVRLTIWITDTMESVYNRVKFLLK